MKWLAVVSLIFIVSKIQAYPQKDDIVYGEGAADKNDAQLMEAELFAYTELLKGMTRPPGKSQNSESAQSQFPNTPSSSMRQPGMAHPNMSPIGSLPSESHEHVKGENIEIDGIHVVQQMLDEIADHQTNALCTDPDQCNCKLKYQVDTKQETTNGVITADCWLINIPYCEGPCYGVFKYVMVLYNVTVIIYF